MMMMMMMVMIVVDDNDCYPSYIYSPSSPLLLVVFLLVVLPRLFPFLRFLQSKLPILVKGFHWCSIIVVVVISSPASSLL